jgi:hypothetical protein
LADSTLVHFEKLSANYRNTLLHDVSQALRFTSSVLNLPEREKSLE